MTQPPQFSIRDSLGNVYGPASADLLRQWIKEGRIVPGMFIASENSTNWSDVATHPVFADLFIQKPLASGAVMSTSLTPPVELAYAAPTGRPNPLAIASLVTGILSFFSCGCCCIPLAFPLGIGGSLLCGATAVVTGIFAIQQIHANADFYTGKPFAVAGIILGSLELLIALGFIIVAIVNVFTSR